MPYEFFPGRRMFMRRRFVTPLIPSEELDYAPLYFRFNRFFPWRRRYW